MRTKVAAPAATTPRAVVKKFLARDTLTGRFRDMYRLGVVERIEVIRQGVPAEMARIIASDMAISQEKLFATVGVSRATMHRKLQAGERLSQEDSERVMGIARLVGQVDAMVHESGNPAGFDAAKWVARWLDTPHAALGGKRPAEFMDTAEGRGLVADLAARLRSGAYA